jgi:hypothetical protein
MDWRDLAMQQSVDEQLDCISTCPSCGFHWRGDGRRTLAKMFNKRVVCPRCFTPSVEVLTPLAFHRRVDRRLPVTEAVDR